MDFTEIPVIDMREVISAGCWDSQLGLLRTACSEVGFFYLAGHGFEGKLITELVDAAREFFSLEMEEKARVRINRYIRGYLPLAYTSYPGAEREGVSHQEGYWMGYEMPENGARLLDGPNLWPTRPEKLKIAFEQYLRAAEPLVSILLKGFSRAIGLSPDTLERYFDNPTSRLKVNHYPPQESEVTESNLGVVPHTDSGAFTILWQDQNGGLEIQNKSGEWVGAPPMDNTFVVNIGNILQYWSNGRFSSTPHRVINRDADRCSIPLFANPDQDAEIRALVGDKENFEPFRYGDYQVELWRRTFPIARIP